jgi:DNA-binding transcriptional LysR family regulator
MFEQGFHRRGIPYDVVIELDSMYMIKRYVTEGIGISVGPSLAIEPEDRGRIGVIRLANVLPIEQAGILTLRGGIITIAAQHSIAAFNKAFGQKRRA